MFCPPPQQKIFVLKPCLGCLGCLWSYPENLEKKSPQLFPRYTQTDIQTDRHTNRILKSDNKLVLQMYLKKTTNSILKTNNSPNTPLWRLIRNHTRIRINTNWLHFRVAVPWMQGTDQSEHLDEQETGWGSAETIHNNKQNISTPT